MATTLACTYGGFAIYNNGWENGWSRYGTGTFIGSPWGGKDANGHSRCAIVKFTTPSIGSSSYNKKIKLAISLYRSSGGYDTYNYRITTTAPAFSEGGNTQITFPSSYMCSGTWYVYTSASYSSVTLTSNSADFQPNTTYYLWMWSDTPSGSPSLYAANNSSYGGLISVSTEHDTASFSAPSASLAGNSGFYGGASISVSSISGYSYIYVGNAASGIYWRKATSGTSISIDADTSSTSKTLYITRANADLGSYFTYSGSSYTKFSCPRYACSVYRHSSSATIYSGTSGSFSPTYSGATLVGLNGSSTGTSATYSANWSNGASLNGKSWYAIYTQTKAITYYRGTSTAYSSNATRTLYGTSSATNYSLTEPTRTYANDSSYEFLGWATSESTTTRSYTLLERALNGGYTTVYGVYKQPESTSTSTCYYYRGSSSRNSVTKTETTGATYLYGKGDLVLGSTTYSYGTISTSCASDSGAVLIGWTASSSSTSSSYSSAESAFTAGYGTIYGIFKKSGSSSNSTVYYYRGSETKNSTTKTTTISDKYYYGAGVTFGGGTSYSYGSIASTCASDSNYSVIGWTADSTSKTSSYSSAEAAFDAGNGTIYGIFRYSSHSSSLDISYYLGSSKKQNVSGEKILTDAYYYGSGKHTGGEISSVQLNEVSTECDGDSGYSLIGWATVSDTLNAEYSGDDLGFYAAVMEGHDKIYGVFSKVETMTYYPQNGQNRGTSSVTNYRYGIGAKTYNRPEVPSLVKSNWNLAGYSSSNVGLEIDSWNSLWDAGIRTVYAIWIPDNHVYYGAGGVWRQAQIYYGVNGEWKPVVVRFGHT